MQENYILPLDYTDLREMKKRQDIEGLLNILETGDIKECREAIRMLGELRTRKAVSPLLGFLETDDVHIRSNAAWSLGEIGHVKAVLPLIGLLNDPVENVRINAAWSLGRIGDKHASKGLVSVDIIFKYKDNTNGEKKSSSVWLQMASVGTNGDHKTEREIERIDSRPKRRAAEGSKRIAKIKRSRRPKPVEYDIPDEAGSDQLEKYPSEIDDTDIEEYPEERAKKIITRREKRPVVREIPEEQEYGYEEETQEIPELTRPEPRTKETRPEPKEIKPEPKIKEIKPEPKTKEIKPEPKTIEAKPEVQAAPPKIPDKPKPEPKLVEIKTEIVKEKVLPEIKPHVEAVTAKPATVPTPGGNVNSAVQLLSNIGMSGMTNAASTVTQLGGEELS